MQISDTWTWTVCNLPLRQPVQGEIANPVIWQLKPSITLLHPKGDGPDPIINLHIESEKSFQFSDELGWNWHKSWKLPTVAVQIELIDPYTKEFLLCPNDIYAQIFAVKASQDENKNLCLTDVGLKGNNKVELVDGKGVFQTLKFSSTSYNNEGVKFHLLVCIFLQVSEDTPPKTLKAILSPPIFVDSRKSVRDIEKITDNKLYIYVNPFVPDNFTKRFVKRESKKKESIEEDIQNNVEGLCSYLTAPNIRNKVKHPIFLSIRFSNCISLHYNPKEINLEKGVNYVEVLQEHLFKDIEKLSYLREVKPEESVFILCIDAQSLEDKSKKKKISESLNSVRCKSLSVVFSKTEVPPHFQKLSFLNSMMELYSKSYSKFAAKAKNYLQDDDNEEEDGPVEKLPPPEKQIINFQDHKAPKKKDWQRYFDVCFPKDMVEKKVKTEQNSSPPSNMIEPTSCPRTLSEMPLNLHQIEPQECRAPVSLHYKNNEPGIVTQTTIPPPNSQGQMILGLLQNKLGYAANPPQQTVFFRNGNIPVMMGQNMMGIMPTTSFPGPIQNMPGNMMTSLVLPQQGIKAREPLIGPGYRVVQNGVMNMLDQFDMRNKWYNQGNYQDLHKLRFEREVQKDTESRLIPPFINEEEQKRIQSKPLLLQWQGQSLGGLKNLFQMNRKDSMELDTRANEITVKNEESEDRR